MKKKDYATLLGIVGAALAGLLATFGGGKHRDDPIDPPPLPAYTLTVHVCEIDCLADHKIPGAVITLDHAERGIPTDGAGNAEFQNVPAGAYTVCAVAEGWREFCAEHRVPADGEVYLALEPDVPPLQPLRTAGKIFRLADGSPFRWKGVTAFRLIDRFARGENIDGFLTDFKGYNVLRVFGYTPAKDWGAAAWEAPTAEQVKAFAAYVERFGFYVEYVALTDDDPARIEPAKALLAQLAGSRTILAEIGNEPQTHKAINTAAFRGACPLLCSSGDYEDSRKWWGQWIGFHSARDSDWPRRAHDAIEYYGGGGPNSPDEPALRVPAVCDEPIRPDQAGYNVADFRAYFGACALMGAGATYHFESGKHGNRPTADELRIAGVALAAMDAFLADAPLGAYARPVENSLRTYVVGNWMVRIRPSGPGPRGWIALDDAGILWRR